MGTPFVPHYTERAAPVPGMIVGNFVGEAILCAGDTVPTDTTAGYGEGCIFMKNSGAADAQLYINIGTGASCDFDPFVTSAILGLSSSAAELNRLDDSLASNGLTRGTGVDAAQSYAAGIDRAGTLITTRIVLDLTDLVGSATDLDIIGEDGIANCHWGQITAAKCGTLIGGYVRCLEVPTGGSDDIDFYSSNVATGTEDVIITDAALGTETALVTSGAAWTSGATKGMTGLPTADDYLYLVNGEAAGGTYTAGKFEIVLFGLGA
jgi:hypothetical protein